MYEQHNLFPLPENKDKRIWRYSSFAKLIHLIETKTLFFPVVSSLPDKYEGHLSDLNKTIDNDKFIDFYKGKVDLEIIKRMREQTFNTFLILRNYTFVNSWILSDEESNLMWCRYSNDFDGVAIQSTVNKFIGSFNETVEVIRIGLINYFDPKKYFVGEDNTYRPFIWKRKYFEDEHEIRALIQNSDLQVKLSGLKVKCNLETLIESICVAPLAGDWVKELIELILKKNGLASITVHKSKLSELPPQ